jgi:K+-sensing histidine kinase KdpD
MSRFLRGELLPTPKPVRAQAIVDQLLKVVEPERRLRGVVIDARVSVGDRVLSVDEDLLLTALSGLLMATVGLAEEQSALAVTVTAEAKGSDVVFSILQEQAAAPSNWTTDGPLTSGTRIVAAFKGRVTMNARSTGTELRVVLPRVQ